MPQNVIDGLRQDIDAKHQEALKALETLASYLKSVPLSSNDQSPVAQETTTVRRPKRSPTGSLRTRVIAAFDEARTVRAVADDLGITTKQVRGVIGSPDLREIFLSQGEIEGVQTYRYVEEPDE